MRLHVGMSASELLLSLENGIVYKTANILLINTVKIE